MQIGNAWSKKTKEGEDMISCNIQSPFLPEGKLSIALFRSREKKSENSPDWNIVWNPMKKKEETSF